MTAHCDPKEKKYAGKFVKNVLFCSLFGDFVEHTGLENIPPWLKEWLK